MIQHLDYIMAVGTGGQRGAITNPPPNHELVPTALLYIES